MDKVLKRRLIGASILIALAVIFVPMLLVDPDSVGDGAGEAIDVPPMPESAREVRRIPLDPEAARVSQSEPESSPRSEDPASTRAPDPVESAAEADRVRPDEEIVLRPDLTAPQPAAEQDEMPADGNSAPTQSAGDAGPEQAEPTDSVAELEPEPESAPTSEPAQPAQVSTGDWAVQVASFGSKDAASQVRARLEALGHVVADDEIVRGQSLLYRLRTGPYPSRAAAEQALAQISATVAGVEPIVREIDDDMREGAASAFAVQVGSFVSEDNAESETARLAGLGFESFRFSEQIGERLIWRVMVGPVSERSEADALKSRVGEQAGVEGLVVSY